MKKEVSSSGLREIILFILHAGLFVCDDNYEKSVIG